jgi:hypothetical protein
MQLVSLTYNVVKCSRYYVCFALGCYIVPKRFVREVESVTVEEEEFSESCEESSFWSESN